MGHEGQLRFDRGTEPAKIDPANQIARIDAGVRLAELVDAATQHGLAPLAGSSPMSVSSATRSAAPSAGSAASTDSPQATSARSSS